MRDGRVALSKCDGMFWKAYVSHHVCSMLQWNFNASIHLYSKSISISFPRNVISFDIVRWWSPRFEPVVQHKVSGDWRFQPPRLPKQGGLHLAEGSFRDIHLSPSNSGTPVSPIFLQKVLPCQRPRRYLDGDYMQMLTGVNSGSRIFWTVWSTGKFNGRCASVKLRPILTLTVPKMTRLEQKHHDWLPRHNFECLKFHQVHDFRSPRPSGMRENRINTVGWLEWHLAASHAMLTAVRSPKHRPEHESAVHSVITWGQGGGDKNHTRTSN